MAESFKGYLAAQVKVTNLSAVFNRYISKPLSTLYSAFIAG